MVKITHKKTCRENNIQTMDTENQDNKMNNDTSTTLCPSPNNKHVEKYLKPQIEEENILISGNLASSQGSSTDDQDRKISSIAEEQSPLPPKTPSLNTNVNDEKPDEKPETNDLGHSTRNQSEGYSTRVWYNTNQLITKFETDNSKELIMCRNYIRGTCKREHKCIYAHKVIPSQMPSVYQFCKSYQNTVCHFRKCKFVHATVTEKEYFFLTGYLPQHTLKHLKDVNISQLPLLQPPAEGIPIQVPSISRDFLPPPPPPRPQIFSVGVMSGTDATTQVRSFNSRSDRDRARARLAPLHRRSLSHMF